MSNVESSLVNGWKGKAEQLEANRDLESGQAKWLKLATEKLPKEVEEIIAQNKEFQARQEETTTPRVKRSK